MLVSYFALLAVLATGCLAAKTRVFAAPAIPHQFPYHVGIYRPSKYRPPGDEHSYYCGGAVVSAVWVLTAASCSSDAHLVEVRAGKHVVDLDEAYEQVRFVVRQIIHPEYKPDFNQLINDNDLALFEVHRPFVFNEFVAAAGIPPDSACFESGSLAGWIIRGTGWSILSTACSVSCTNELYYSNYLPVIDSRTCVAAINEILSDQSLLSGKISSNQTCSGPVGESFGVCAIVHGNAFVKKVDDEYVVIGIVSMGNSFCGTPNGAPTVYTRVAPYSEWINAVLKSPGVNIFL